MPSPTPAGLHRRPAGPGDGSGVRPAAPHHRAAAGPDPGSARLACCNAGTGSLPFLTSSDACRARFAYVDVLGMLCYQGKAFHRPGGRTCQSSPVCLHAPR